MPTLRIALLSAVLLSSAGLSACTTANGDAMQGLAPAPVTAAGDPVLPEQVAAIPYAADSTPTQIAKAEAAMGETDAGGKRSVAGASEARSAQEVASLGNEAVSAVAMRPNAYAKAGSSDGSVDGLIVKYASIYEVPVDLVRRVVKRESNFRPSAYNNGHWGLMQIKHATARGMGYQGPAKGLLDAETNLKYAVKYLRGAWLVAGGNHDQAVRLYARGYYYDAKRKGLLEETGLGRDRVRRRG